MVPSCSVRVTRRASCSHDTSRPWRSRVLPLVLFDGLRKMLTTPVSSSHFMTRLLGMSLQRRKRPSPKYTGPSDHRKPVASRSTAARLSRYFAKRGSSTCTSGSGYLTGSPCHRSMPAPYADDVGRSDAEWDGTSSPRRSLPLGYAGGGAAVSSVGVKGTASHPVVAGAARLDGAQPPRNSERVPRGGLDPHRADRRPTARLSRDACVERADAIEVSDANTRPG